MWLRLCIEYVLVLNDLQKQSAGSLLVVGCEAGFRPVSTVFPVFPVVAASLS
jgi:hypothetical protein